MFWNCNLLQKLKSSSIIVVREEGPANEQEVSMGWWKGVIWDEFSLYLSAPKGKGEGGSERFNSTSSMDN